jgi:hypothetical protein
MHLRLSDAWRLIAHKVLKKVQLLLEAYKIKVVTDNERILPIQNANVNT